MQNKENTIYILGDRATQLFTKSLKKQTKKQTLSFQITEGDHNQIERQVFDLSSALYQTKPSFLIISRDTNALLNKFAASDQSRKSDFADKQIKNDTELIQTIENHLPNCKVILNNYYELQDPSFGNYANKTSYSFSYQLKKLNFEIMNLAQRFSNLFICDLASIVQYQGLKSSLDFRMSILADMPLSLDIQKDLAKNIIDIITAINGKINKCLILDLDNTLWGGVIGDDGIENIQIGALGIGKAFSAMQQYAKMLKDRGIILCVCSKNTESIAKEPFEKHPDMLLQLDDIALFMANWENKAKNITEIQRILNIGFDSMVFVDDNPFERNLVRESIPEINVPELPEDPAEYVPFLVNLNLFEIASASTDDGQRTKQYKAEAERVESKKAFANEDDFLRNLGMQSEVKAFDTFSTPRVAQLTQRSNQFNLRTQRYTEADIKHFIIDDNYETMSFSLDDKYGNHGLISLIILKKKEDCLFIDTWIMSCRVLKRGMELFVLTQIVNFARDNNVKEVVGEYIPTKKNGIVADHYELLGFKKQNNLWTLDINTYKEKANYIQLKDK